MGSDLSVIEGETYSVDNDYLAIAGAVLLLLLIVLWIRCRSKKKRRVKRHCCEIVQSEVYTRLRKLDDEIMTAVMTTVKVALPRPDGVKTKPGGPPPRRDGLPGDDAIAATEAAAFAAAQAEGPPPLPPRARTRAQEAEKELSDDIGRLFGTSIAPANNLGHDSLVSVTLVKQALLQFIEHHLLHFVSRVARYSYTCAGNIFKTTGFGIFDANSQMPTRDMLGQGKREAPMIPWRMCCCFCPGMVLENSLTERSLIFAALRDRMLGLGGVKTFEATHSTKKNKKSAATQLRMFSLNAPPVITPCVRHGWVNGAVLEGGGQTGAAAGQDTEMQEGGTTAHSPPLHGRVSQGAIGSQSVKATMQPRREPRNSPEECKKLEELFASHFSLFVPPCTDSRAGDLAACQSLSQSPFVLRISAMDEGEMDDYDDGDDLQMSSPFNGGSRGERKPTYSEEEDMLLKAFAVTVSQDRSIFACPSSDPTAAATSSFRSTTTTTPTSTLRGDCHLYLQLLRSSVLYFDALPKKTQHAMYDMVPSLDRELKAWLKDAVVFLADREAETWRVGFMALAKQVIEMEVQAATGRIKDRKTKGEYSAQYVEATIQREKDDHNEAALRVIECRSSQGELVKQFQNAVMSEFGSAFTAERVEEPIEVKSACCGFCLPDLPAIRRSIPPTEDKITSSMKAILRDIVLGDARTEEHLREARAELTHLREKLLDLMYPPGAVWSSDGPRGGNTTSGLQDVDVLYSPTGDEGSSTPQNQTWADADFQTPGGGAASSDTLPLVSMDDIVENSFKRMLERLERTVTGAMNRREERVALEVIQHNPIINKNVQKQAQVLFAEQQGWMTKFSKMMLVLKKLHRQCKDLCAIGREYDTQLNSGAQAPPAMYELLFEVKDNFALLESDVHGGAEFVQLFPFADAVHSFNHWADRMEAPLYTVAAAARRVESSPLQRSETEFGSPVTASGGGTHSRPQPVPPTTR